MISRIVFCYADRMVPRNGRKGGLSLYSLLSGCHTWLAGQSIRAAYARLFVRCVTDSILECGIEPRLRIN